MIESEVSAQKKRSKEWFDFITWYFTGQEFGIANNLEGAEGVITFLQTRKELELDILQELDMETLLLNNSDYDWEARTEEIKKLLDERLKEPAY